MPLGADFRAKGTGELLHQGVADTFGSVGAGNTKV